jgi:zinc protease
MLGRTAVVLVLFVLTTCGPGTKEEAPVLLRVADDPTVTLKVWFKVGSQNDPPGKEGLAHLTARLIAEGSTRSNSYEEILALLYPMAAGYSVTVDREMTVLSGRVHVDNLETYYGLFTKAFLEPGFREDDFERVRSDSLSYLRDGLRYQADEELAKAALYGFVFRGTPYAHPTEGTVRGLESITLEDVKRFYATYYTRANAVPALGGGCDDALATRFRNSLRLLAPGATVEVPKVTPEKIEGLQVLLVDKPGADASISIGFPIVVTRGEQDFYALWIANSWLGEHRSSASHLYQVIREARGLNYGDYSYIEAFPDGGRRQVPPSHVGRRRQIFEVWIRTLPRGNAHFALRTAVRELKSLVDDGLSEAQFELTRSFLRKYVLHFADTTSGRLGYALDDRFYGLGDEGHLQRFRRMMDEITLDEVNRAIRTHLRDDNLKIAVVTGDAEVLRRALVENAPSPIEYDTPKPAEVLVEDREIEAYPLRIGPEAVQIVSVEQIFEE